jgi:hypothetical protein
MGKIYRRAAAVIVMVGGVSAAQGVDKMSTWIDRAWTLQEVSMGNDIYAMVDWPYQSEFRTPPITRQRHEDPNDERFHQRFVKVVGSVSLIPLEKLLTMDLMNATAPDLPRSGFSVKCFESDPNNAARALQRRNAATFALLTVMHANDEYVRYCGAWRSMFLRVSEKEQDMIYSMMDLIGIQLDVDYTRTLSDLYADVAKKVAAKGFPAWLGVGGGSGDIIPRDPLSGLWPKLPKREGRSLATYEIGRGVALPVTEFISQTPDYISNYDIRFTTPSIPHLVCCRMFDHQVRPIPFKPIAGNAGEYHMCQLYVYGTVGTCMYKGEVGEKVVIIGETGNLESSSLPFQRGVSANNWYLYFVSLSTTGWIRVGAGTVNIFQGTLPDDRRHINFGENSQTTLPDWVCDCDIVGNDTRTLPLTRSYGTIARALDPNGNSVDELTGERFSDYSMSWYANKVLSFSMTLKGRAIVWKSIKRHGTHSSRIYRTKGGRRMGPSSVKWNSARVLPPSIHYLRTRRSWPRKVYTL